VTLGEYATFTQADLDSGNIRFQHDGGETFVYAAAFSVSAGLTTLDANGNPVTDIWTPTLNIYVTPVNDLPVVTGSSSTVIAEGETLPDHRPDSDKRPGRRQQRQRAGRERDDQRRQRQRQQLRL
jgi:hypothetical protein